MSYSLPLNGGLSYLFYINSRDILFRLESNTLTFKPFPARTLACFRIFNFDWTRNMGKDSTHIWNELSLLDFKDISFPQTDLLLRGGCIAYRVYEPYLL